jgi:hypothetical protein
MEHIPPQRVDDVLANIRDCCRKGAFFQIATRKDVMGQLIGQPLHLTVQSADWWAETLSRHWQSVDVDEGDGSLTATCLTS